MDILFWIIIIACFIMSFVALVQPIIPGVVILWVGLLVYSFGINSLHFTFWIIAVIFTIFIFLLSIIANQTFIKKSDGTKWSSRISVPAVVIGSFFFPPFGLLIVPFIAVFLSEKAQKKSIGQSFRVAGNTVIAFLVSSVAQAILQIILISIFFLYVWL
jgi:uncharacterized protein YqgC (DUF456 family)